MCGKLSLIVVVALLTCPACKSEDVLWGRDENFDDFIKVHGSSNTEVRRAISLAHCASLCTSNSWCSSFFFLHTTEECRLNEFVFAKRDGGQSSPGAIYFKALSAACPSRDGYVWLRGLRTCIKVYTDVANFTTAYRTCVNAGSQLVVLDKKDKLTGVAVYIADFVIRAFIGGMRDGAANGTRTNWDSTLHPLYWLNGVKVVTSGPDSYWMDPRLDPSNTNGEEGCMEILWGLWNDVPCYFTSPFICEKI